MTVIQQQRLKPVNSQVQFKVDEPQMLFTSGLFSGLDFSLDIRLFNLFKKNSKD